MRIKQYRQYTAQTPKSENVTVAGYQEAAKIEEKPANVEPARVNPIPTGLSHVITVYGLIQPSASRNRVKTSNLSSKRKQFCTLREGNPGNVLLTSRIRLKYFYQCSIRILEEFRENFKAIWSDSTEILMVTE